MSLPLLALALAAPSWACPTVATGTPHGLTYDVIARTGERTTFTVSINPTGEAQDFALVMPVPGELDVDAVRTLDGEIFARLEGQTGILEMPDAGCATPDDGFQHPCPEILPPTDDTGAAASDGGGDGESYGDVEVEAEFLVGEYQITILSATESLDLFRWLGDHGYNLADPTIPVIQDYIDQNMRFLAAKVADEATVADGSALSPLQIAYDSPMFGIPIRLAAQSSPGQQDMLIYALTPETGGQVGISNYPMMTVEDTCIWEYGEQDSHAFGDFYEARFDAAWVAEGQAAWTVEWAGANWDCNPCSGIQATGEDLEQLGFNDVTAHQLTRLHVRYTDQTAIEDLVLYESNRSEPVMMTYAMDTSQNRWCIDPCEAERLEAAEEERAERLDAMRQDARERMEQIALECPSDDGDEDDDGDDDVKAGGCATVAPVGGVFGLGLGLLGLARRRRHQSR